MDQTGLVLQVSELKKQYLTGPISVMALKGISLDIRQGEMVAIMGTSGSGKTTLLNILGCLDRPSTGRYWLDGEDVSHMDDKRLSQIRNEKIGFIFQHFNLLPKLSAVDNVKLPLLYSHYRLPKDVPLEALKRVGLENRSHHLPSQLSGGQQQRVAIARALVLKPAILMADEPTGNLDSRSGEELMLVLQQLHREGATIVMVTHDRQVAQHSTRIIEMRDGRVLCDCPVESKSRLKADEILAAMPKPEVDTI